MTEKGFDFRAAQVAGVAFVMEEDKAGDPVYVGLFGADGIMLEAERVADLVEEFSGSGRGAHSQFPPVGRLH